MAAQDYHYAEPTLVVNAQSVRVAHVHADLNPSEVQQDANGTACPPCTADQLQMLLTDANLPVGSSSCIAAHLCIRGDTGTGVLLASLQYCCY